MIRCDCCKQELNEKFYGIRSTDGCYWNLCKICWDKYKEKYLAMSDSEKNSIASDYIIEKMRGENQCV